MGSVDELDAEILQGTGDIRQAVAISTVTTSSVVGFNPISHDIKALIKERNRALCPLRTDEWQIVS